jgi:hypothetical protein
MLLQHVSLEVVMTYVRFLALILALVTVACQSTYSQSSRPMTNPTFNTQVGELGMDQHTLNDVNQRD